MDTWQRKMKSLVKWLVSRPKHWHTTNESTATPLIGLNTAEEQLPKGYFVQQFDDSSFKAMCPELGEESEAYSKGMHKEGVRDPNRVLMAHLLIDIANKCSTGHYAEVGAYQGNFARITWNKMHSDCKLYLFDTFDGFTSSDVTIEKQETGLTVRPGHYSDTSLELVVRNVTGGRQSDRLVIMKGCFPETFVALGNTKWRFVHLDCDLYEPTRYGLGLFWPMIVQGGVLLVHDYNSMYTGVRRAVDEFFAPLGIVPVPCPDKSGSAAIIKNVEG